MNKYFDNLYSVWQLQNPPFSQLTKWPLRRDLRKMLVDTHSLCVAKCFFNHNELAINDGSMIG